MSKIQQWVAGTAVVVIAILIAGWFLVISPRNAQVNELNTKTAASQAQADALRSQIAVLIGEKAKLPTQEAKIAELAKQIPTDASLPALIRQLTGAASAAGVDLVTVTPGSPAALSSTGTTTLSSAGTSSSASQGAAGTATSATGSGGASLMTVPMQLTVRGSYFQLEEFVSNLQQLQRRFLVLTFTLGPSQSATSGSTTTSATGTGNSLDLQLTGTAFEAPAAPTSSQASTTTGPAASGPAN